MRKKGTDQRGSNRNRRRRKFWLLKTYGDGETCPCIFCGKTLTYETLTTDRIIPGGPYNRNNVQPACGPCNSRRGNKPMSEFAQRGEQLGKFSRLALAIEGEYK